MVDTGQLEWWFLSLLVPVIGIFGEQMMMVR